MAKNRNYGYFVGDDYSFTIFKDEKGRKYGKLVNTKTGEVLCNDMYQRVVPEKMLNLVNSAKLIISAAWQDGKILPSEKDAFTAAFAGVEFTEEQKAEILKEFDEPTPVEELLKNELSRDQQMLILETSLLLVLADNEFHPKEKDFIEKLVKSFNLDERDFALIYYILPEEAKKYIVKEKLHETLMIKEEEIIVLDKLNKADEPVEVNHEIVYSRFVNNWKNRSERYKRRSTY